jgi:aryl-alcohol dehydrogenase-like predicted oxidoreductase/predicted dehydrogenase
MTRWGILGTGMIAKAFAKALIEAEGSELVAVASKNEERAKEFSQNFEANFFGDYETLILQDNVDAIYIATPHPEHFDLSLSCLNNQKAVLCEKPMTMNATETMVLIDAARKNKVLLMEAFMYKTHPQTKKLLDLISNRLKGPIQIDADFCFSVDVPETHRLVNKEMGGGSIMDIGCYPLSMTRMLVGAVNGRLFSNPIEIEAKAELNDQGVDLNASAQLRFEDGSTASIASATNLETASDVTITDGNNTLFVNQPWHCGEFTDRKSEIILKDKEGNQEIYKIETNKDLYAFEIEHFTKQLAKSKLESQIISHADSHGNMIGLDSWRKKVGVFYSQDEPENRRGSITGKVSSLKDKTSSMKTLPGLSKPLFPIVFGCDNQSDANHAFAMFDHYRELGGNVFDTAYIYNDGMSDEYLGRWVKARNNREEVVILGKGAHTPDCFPSSIRPQLEESLSRLQSNYLAIYCLHRDNPDIPVSEFIDALNQLKTEGLINVFGASNWSLERFREANEYALQTKQQPFTLLSNNFSLARMIEPVWPGCVSCSEEDFKSYLEENQIAILPWSSQARGFFLDEQEFQGATHGANPNLTEQKRVWHSKDNILRRDRCFKLAKELNVEPIQVALSFVINQKFPSFPLIGPRNFFETESSLKTLDFTLSSEQVAWLDLK